MQNRYTNNLNNLVSKDNILISNRYSSIIIEIDNRVTLDTNT